MRQRRLIASIGVAGLLFTAAACGSDDSGDSGSGSEATDAAAETTAAAAETTAGAAETTAGGAETTAAPAAGGEVPEGAMTELGAGEGEVNLIAWAGYVEDGSTDPAVDWVTSFEEQTGCTVNVKVGNSSDELPTVTLTLQPVSSSKLLTQSTAGSVEPSST